MASQDKSKPIEWVNEWTGQAANQFEHTHGTIMRESFTVNTKPPCSRMHGVWGLERRADVKRRDVQ